MSILDDAIREHLELKRAHGADEAELKRLEDEAFGPPERPSQAGESLDPFAEAPTEFLTAPAASDAPATAEPAAGRRIDVADLQEPPPPVDPVENAEDAATEGPADEGPAEEEHPAMEHEAIAQPSPGEAKPHGDPLLPDAQAAAATEAERHAEADQPTELFDVEGQFADAGEVEVSRTADEGPEDEFDEFFSEQRLSDELNQALEAPLSDEPGTSTYEHDLPEPDSREQELPEPDSREHELPEERQAEPGPADALEDTPEFLEETPEDDDAWFEQRPPKDFDFGD